MDQCIKFKGEKVEYYNYRRLLIISFLEAFALNLGIFGEENLQCLIFFTLCLMLLFYLSNRIFSFCIFRFIKFSGFMLDDNAQKIITENGKIIPYNKVKTINIIKYINALKVQAGLGIFTKHFILVTGNIKKENELLRELKNRFVKVRISNRYISVAVFAFIMVSLTCYVYFKNPAVRVFPEKRIQKTQKFSETERYTFNKISFSLPKNFKLAEKKGARYIFCNQTEEIVIYVNSLSILSKAHEEFVLSHTSLISPHFTLQFGIKDDYELLNVIFNSHTGLVSLDMKVEFLKDYACETLKIYGIRKKEEFRGFLMTGMQEDEKMKMETYLTVVNKKSDRQINFHITSENEIKDELADMIINGLE